jgi:ADP-heptose:LPS heptosyltransferase
VILIGTGSSEMRWANEIHRLLPSAVATFGLPVRTTAAIIKRAGLFLGFNSGPGHLAAAVRTPSLIVFRSDHRVGNEIRKWLPPSNLSRALVPDTENEISWLSFLEQANALAQELRATLLASSGMN